MDTIELIKQRISTNKFDTSRTLSEAEVKELVSYATEAPSAYNIQNWRFVAVTAPEEKARLRSVAYNQQKVVDAAVTFIVLGDLRGYEKLPQILKPMVDDGLMDPATAEDGRGARLQVRRRRSIRPRRGDPFGLIRRDDADDRRPGQGARDRPDDRLRPRGREARIQYRGSVRPGNASDGRLSSPGNWPRKPRLGVEDVLAFNKAREF